MAIRVPKLLEEFLAARRGAKVAVKVPQRGRGRGAGAPGGAQRAASVTASASGGPAATRRSPSSACRGPSAWRVPPHRIEAFDISHLQGTDSVASMVVFEDGKPKKSDYRLFNIASQELLAPDDFKSMAEVGRAALSPRPGRATARGRTSSSWTAAGGSFRRR